MSSFQIKIVETKSDWKDFIDLPWKIYKNEPYWVPPLKIAVKELLNVQKNPFFKHAYMRPFIAYRGSEPVGRIVGVIDEVHNQYHNEKTAFFGFYECINDLGLSNELFEQVKSWAREWGMETLRGPCSPSTNHECGLLVEGFEDPPQIMMTFNPKYYISLIENAGFHKAKDLFAYDVHHDSPFNERLLRHAEKLKQRNQVTFRTANLKNFDREVELMAEIYNDAWEKNWGFVPMNLEEFRHQAKDLKMIVDPELILIAEVRGEPAAFGIGLPDINRILKKIPSGELFPTGLAKFLWYLKGPMHRKVVNRCRIVTLGVRKKYVSVGIGALLYKEYQVRAPAAGYYTGEASWILEDNVQMIKAAQLMGAEKTKTYRIYDLPL